MRAIEIPKPGPPEVLTLVDRPAPTAAQGEVLVDVIAAGVNRPDLLQRVGNYPPPKGVTDIPGLEVAGRIVAVGGADADGAPRSASGRVWRIGDEVCALVAGGGYAEFVAVPGVQCLPKPDGLSFIEAAAIPETFFTVWTNVFKRGRLAAGEWLLVHGGSGGIGTTAIQLAVAHGAHVIVTAGSDAKCRACEALGATRGVNYHTEDFVAEVKRVTADHGVNVVLDVVGGDYTPKNLDCLARDGRLVQIGLQRNAETTISLRPIMLKRLTLTGSTLRARTPREKGEIAKALESHAWPWLATKRVHPLIHATYPMKDAGAAHRALESGDVVGKIVIVVAGA